MKPLFTYSEFKNAKSTEKLPCTCYHCSNTFFKIKKEITATLKGNSRNAAKFCSLKCFGDFNRTTKTVPCDHCGSDMIKSVAELKRTNKNFCSHSCHITFMNKNKTTGYRRSKLEIWLEKQLFTLYPNLPIDFNKTTAIGSELDIYIPSLNLAVELNGSFHYEPIFGVDKLNKIQSNDKSKSLACHEAKIDLCIIDTSTQKYFKPKSSQRYLDIIINIINERLLTS